MGVFHEGNEAVGLMTSLKLRKTRRESKSLLFFHIS